MQATFNQGGLQPHNDDTPDFDDRQVLRQSLLAVVDCPYVRQLQEEIAAYAAACELEMVFRHNKA